MRERAFRRPPAVRLAVPSGEVVVDDALQGRVRQDVAREVGDFVLRRGDGIWAYQLAVVADDLAMGITEIVRAVDLLGSAPRQALLARLLGGEPPRFAHVPLVVGPDGERLAKRHGALSLGELRERGADPRSVVGLLAALSGLAAPGARLEPGELVAGFRLDRLPRGPARLEPGAAGALVRVRLAP